MEKQRIATIRNFYRRLLTVTAFLIFFSSSLFSQNVNYNNLIIKHAENQNLFTNTDLKFLVKIADVKPSQIQVLSSMSRQNVTYRSIKKTEVFDESGNFGTEIEIWLSFDKKGIYNQISLPVMIKNRRRNLAFESIEITEDPSKKSPLITIKFSNGYEVYSDQPPEKNPIFNAKVGEKITFTVYLQYINQLVQLNWDLPQNSIFTRTEEYEITEIKYRERTYTHDLIPVSTFEWTGLAPGEQQFPKIKLSAMDYNGYRTDLLTPKFSINFTENGKSSEKNEPDIFKDAFTSFDSEKKDIFENDITDETCRKLADLYYKEQISFFGFKNAHEKRIELENKIGVPSTAQNSIPIIYICILLTLCITFTVFVVVFIIKKRNLLLIIFIALLSSCVIALGMGIAKRFQSYGICKGCMIYSIPSENAEAFSEIGAGNRVLITEHAGSWINIQLGDSSGWCKKDDIIEIKR